MRSFVPKISIISTDLIPRKSTDVSNFQNVQLRGFCAYRHICGAFDDLYWIDQAILKLGVSSMLREELGAGDITVL